MATVLGIVAVVVSIWLLVEWIYRPMGERLRSVLGERDEIAILMHPNPDPNAMASAMGVAYIASTVAVDSTIYYTGQIRHQENRVFHNILDPEFERINRVDDIGADDVVLVDHNEPRGFEGSETIMPIAVIDHHPGGGIGLDFTDRRPDYGSTASIIAEYLREVGASTVHLDDVDETVEPHEGRGDVSPLPPNIVTGLMYGIYSDTNRLTAGTIEADFDAASYLSEGVDERVLDRIANPEVDAEILAIKNRAFSNREQRGSFIVSDVGEINNIDAIPQAADEIILLEGVTAAVVHGTREGTTHLSGRSRDDRVHMGSALEAVAEEIPDAGAGGHSRMGGGKFPTPELATDGGSGDPVGGSPPAFDDLIFDALEGDV